MMYYAGIGSQSTPEDVCERMAVLAGILEKKGYCLRSGGARGADTAFYRGVRSKKNTDIYLPTDPIPMWCDVFTQHFHPNPYALNDFVRKLMNRNAMQVLGRDGNTPVHFVVCWTKNGELTGGTAQAIKIAKHFNIPVFNFYRENDINFLKNALKHGLLEEPLWNQ